MTVRVLVVEDSMTVRRRLCEVLDADPDISVVAEAGDGKRAFELCHDLRPDVVTLDMMLPVMSGVAATELIMAHCPTPILIVSASTNRGELFETYDALAAGAVDVLDKPRGDARDDDWERRFRSTVKLVARIKVITHVRGRLGPMGAWPRAANGSSQMGPGASAVAQAAHAARIAPRVVAIGASTGGPNALLEVLRALPESFAPAVLVVLHLHESFGGAFAEWLASLVPHGVAYARDGDAVIGGGRVWMAPPGKHLVVRDGRMRVTADPERHSCRPSVDVLFESVAQEVGRAAAACLLTGMGRDGAAGLLAIKRAGGVTIAQDESTSIVYGMPREAALLGAADRVLPLGEIGPALAALGAPRHRIMGAR